MKIALCALLLLLLPVSINAAEDEDNLDVDIEDYILQEILSDAEIAKSEVDSSAFLRLVDRYLQGLMRRFRNKVLKLYRKMTCTSNDLCNPFQLSSAYSTIDGLSFQRNVDFQLTGLKRLDYCVLPFDLTDYSVFHMQSQIRILTAVSMDTNLFHLLSVEEHGACKIVSNLHNPVPPPICMHSLTIDQQVNLMVIYACTSNYNLVHIYMLTDSSLEMLELIEAERVENVFDMLISGSHYLCLVINKRCQLYVWTGTVFELTFQHNLSTIGLGLKISSFSHLSDYYLVSIGESESSLQSSVGVWRVQNDEEFISLDLYQALHECKAVNFHLFQLGGLEFIVIACEDVSESYLYWWSGSQFLLWQSIALNLKTLSWTSVILDNGDVVLMALHQKDDEQWLLAYILEDGHYQPSLVKSKAIKTSINMIFPIRQSNSLLAINNRNIGIYKLEMLVQDPREVDESDDVSEYVNQMEQLAKRQETMIQSLKTDLEHYRNLSKDHTILNKKSNENFDCGSAENVLETFETRLNILEEKRSSLKSFHNLKELRVKTLVVQNVLNVSRITLNEGNINNIDFDEMKKSVLSKTSDQVFDADIMFEGGLNVHKLKTTSPVNGVNYENIAKIDAEPIVFTRPQSFKNLEVNSTIVKGLVNEAKVSDWVLKQSLSKIVIHGRKTFKKLNIAGNMRLSGGKINNVDVKRIFSSVVTRIEDLASGDIHVTGNVTINRKISALLVNGIDISNLARNVIYTSQEQQFPDLRLDSLAVDNLIIRGFLNGVKVEKDLLTTETDQEIEVPVVIKGNSDVMNNVEIVSEQVNGIHNWASSVVTRCGNETIRGRKVFADALEIDEISSSGSGHLLHHFHDVNVEHLTVNTLNDIEDVNDLLSNSLRRNSQNLSFHGRLFCSSLKLKGPVTEMGVDKLHQIYFTLDTPQNISAPLLLVGGNVFVNGSVQFGDNAHINGINFDNLKHNCLMKSGDQTLRKLELEDATFLNGANIMDNDNILHHLLQKIDWRLNTLEVKRDVHLEGDLDSQYLNGIHLDSFLTRIYSVQDHLHLYGKTFRHLIVSGDVEVNPRLNGVNCNDFFQNIVRLSTNQQISGDIRVTKPVLCLNGNVTAKIVNGFELKHRLSQLVQIEDYGIVKQHVQFTNGLEIWGDVYLNLLNGKKFELLNNVILQSPQDFLNTITFSGKITIGELEVRGSINGANAFDWLFLNDNRTFNGQVYFKAPAHFSNLSVNTSITELSTTHHFNHLVAKHVELNGLLNGLKIEKLPSLMLSRSSNQTFSSSKVVFNTDVVIDHLITKNPPIISGIDLDEIVNRGLTTNTAQIIYENFVFSRFSDINFEKITVRGHFKIDNVSSTNNFKTEFENGGWTHFGNVIFYDHLTVQGELLANLNVENLKVNTVNNITLKTLIDNRVTLSTNQTIYSPVKFETIPLFKSPKSCPEKFQTVYEKEIEFKCRVVIEEQLQSKYNLTLRL